MIEKSELATQIVQAAQEAFGGGKFGEIRGTGRKPTTAAIKQTFHDLGIKLGYRTAWSGSGTDAEWKYDLVWYEEDKDGYTIRLPLILEDASEDLACIDWYVAPIFGSKKQPGPRFRAPSPNLVDSC